METSVAEKLQALVKLQKIDSRLDAIRKLRGSLPEEVSDLEDDLEGLRTRVSRFEEQIEEFRKEIANRNITIKEQKDMLKRFEDQQMNVKNNREFEAISKEIELANLEILTCEKKIKQFNVQIEEKKADLAEVQRKYEERSKDLQDKRNELEVIVAETEKEEIEYIKQAQEAMTHIDDRLCKAYMRIRRNMRNGLAVVTTDRSACGGCFAIIPPQRHYEIRQHKKIIVCENCGRILADNVLFDEVVPV